MKIGNIQSFFANCPSGGRALFVVVREGYTNAMPPRNPPKPEAAGHPRRGEERLLRAHVIEVAPDGDPNDPVLVLDVEGLEVYAPVRVRESKTIDPE